MPDHLGSGPIPDQRPGWEGEQVPAALLGKLGALVENARDLAYRLYTICERKSWAPRLGIKIPTNVTMRMLKTGLFAGVC